MSAFLGSGEVVICRKCFRKSLHAEVGQSGTEEYRGQLSLADQLLIKLCAGTVQKLDLIHELFLLLRHR